MSINITLHWRKRHLKESILAICYAVRLGYTTRDQLLAALPQFSRSRILLSLDVLLSANMADINMGNLSINADMSIVEEIIGKPVDLPILMMDRKAFPQLLRRMFTHLGLSNPAGAETLLRATIN